MHSKVLILTKLQKSPTDIMDVDHIKPKSKGGSDSPQIYVYPVPIIERKELKPQEESRKEKSD